MTTPSPHPHMPATEVPTADKPERPKRRWRRWSIAGVLAAAAAFWVVTPSPEVRQAQAISIGMSMDQVRSILGAGVEQIDGNATILVKGRRNFRLCRIGAVIQEYTGISFLCDHFCRYEVMIGFDRDENVSWISRGNETVRATPNQ